MGALPLNCSYSTKEMLLVVMNLIPPTAFWSRSFLINISQVFEQDGTYGRR